MIKKRNERKHAFHCKILFSEFDSFNSWKQLELMIWKLLVSMKGSISFEQH